MPHGSFERRWAAGTAVDTLPHTRGCAAAWGDLMLLTRSLTQLPQIRLHDAALGRDLLRLRPPTRLSQTHLHDAPSSVLLERALP